MVVNYHLVHIVTGTQAGIANATILNRSRLVGARINVAGTGGAGAGFVNISLEHNNSAQANADTNNPPRQTVLATFLMSYGNAATSSASSNFIPLDRPLQVGDIISASQVQTGTGPASNRVSIDLYVQEAN